MKIYSPKQENSHRQPAAILVFTKKMHTQFESQTSHLEFTIKIKVEIYITWGEQKSHTF